jgi:hypothetical protein
MLETKVINTISSYLIWNHKVAPFTFTCFHVRQYQNSLKIINKAEHTYN